MIKEVGCKRVADLDAEFLRQARTDRDDLSFIASVCAASELRSHWVSSATNSIDRSLRQNGLRQEVTVGLALYRLERYLLDHSDDLRLAGPGGRLTPVSADMLWQREEFSEIDMKGSNLSLLQNALRSRARSRSNWFSFLTYDWTVRPVSEFPNSQYPDEDKILEAARNDLALFVGAPLLLLTNQRLRDALDFAEGAASPITKSQLAERVKLSVDGKRFQVLWENLRGLGANLARRGRPAGRKDKH